MQTTDNCQITLSRDDKSIRHRGLRRLHETGDRSRVRPDLVDKVERILPRLDAAPTAADVDAPSFGLHRLSGNLKGFWAVAVSRNWRVIFRFDDGDAYDVDFIDYH